MRNALLVLGCLLSTGALAGEPEAKCCFTNAAYAGVCEVVPAKGESCQSIRDYLNTPNSVGKSYCAGTAIRGGWELVACKSDPQASSAPGRSTRRVGPPSP